MLIVLDDQNLQILEGRPRHMPLTRCTGGPAPRHEKRRGKEIATLSYRSLVIIRLQMDMGNIPLSTLVLAALPLYGSAP
jgi:hypothetical protein